MKIHKLASNFALRPAPLLLSFTLVLSLCPKAHANPFDESLTTPEAIGQLEQKAAVATPREQCFLYTELVHSMTELAGKQILQGDTDHASATLKRVEHYAHLIHMNLAADAKRLKNAELLMHHTTHRLVDYMHAASGDDQAVLKSTLKQLDQVQDEMLTQVFAH